MRYKVGDEVVLKDGRVAKVAKVNHPVDYTVKTENNFVLVTDGMIDDNKTAELKLDKTLEHYQGELEKIVAEKNNREINNIDIDLSKMYEDEPEDKFVRSEDIAVKHTLDSLEKYINDDAVQPDHYRKGEYEAIDLIKDVTMDYSGYEGYLIGNIIKYLYRANYKGNKLEDLKKGQYYYDELIEWEESLNE